MHKLGRSDKLNMRVMNQAIAQSIANRVVELVDSVPADRMAAFVSSVGIEQTHNLEHMSRSREPVAGARG